MASSFDCSAPEASARLAWCFFSGDSEDMIKIGQGLISDVCYGSKNKIGKSTEGREKGAR